MRHVERFSLNEGDMSQDRVDHLRSNKWALSLDQYPGIGQIHDDIMNIIYSKLPGITGISKEDIIEFFKDDRYENRLDEFLNEVTLALYNEHHWK